MPAIARAGSLCHRSVRQKSLIYHRRPWAPCARRNTAATGRQWCGRRHATSCLAAPARQPPSSRVQDSGAPREPRPPFDLTTVDHATGGRMSPAAGLGDNHCLQWRTAPPHLLERVAEGTCSAGLHLQTPCSRKLPLWVASHLLVLVVVLVLEGPSKSRTTTRTREQHPLFPQVRWFQGASQEA